MTTKPPSPLLYPAVLLSAASLAWTTWSLVDLLGAGWIGVTVATGADIVWASVIVAEARGLRIAGRKRFVPAIGWATLAAVVILLSWHGIDRGSAALAAAGPLLPLGAKIVWVLAIADMRDPAALTDDEQHALAELERGMSFERARHRIEMERREMNAELLLTEVSTDFDIELARQDRTRELGRRRPLELPEAQPAEPVEPRAQSVAESPAHPIEPQTPGTTPVLASSQAVAPEPAAQPEEPEALTFGFSAHLSAQSAQRAKAVAQVAELLAQDPGLTSGQITEELGVSAATAKRYLREARQVRP